MVQEVDPIPSPSASRGLSKRTARGSHMREQKAGRGARGGGPWKENESKVTTQGSPMHAKNGQASPRPVYHRTSKRESSGGSTSCLPSIPSSVPSQTATSLYPRDRGTTLHVVPHVSAAQTAVPDCNHPEEICHKDPRVPGDRATASVGRDRCGVTLLGPRTAKSGAAEMPATCLPVSDCTRKPRGETSSTVLATDDRSSTMMPSAPRLQRQRWSPGGGTEPGPCAVLGDRRPCTTWQPVWTENVPQESTLVSGRPGTGGSPTWRYVWHVRLVLCTAVQACAVCRTEHGESHQTHNCSAL